MDKLKAGEGNGKENVIMGAMLCGVLDHYKSSVPTIPQMFYNTVQNAGSQPANTFKCGREWVTISYREWAQISEEIAAALIKHGVKKGDDIAIMSKPCAQVGWADMAIMLTGAVVTTITPLVNDHELKHIVNGSDVKYVFVENRVMVQRIDSLWDQMPSLKGIVCLQESTGDHENIFSLEYFREIGRNHNMKTSDLGIYWQRLSPEDPARLDYFKSTVGQLKCSQIKHGEWLQTQRTECRNRTTNMQGKYHNVFSNIFTIPNINARTMGLFSMIAIGEPIIYGSGPSKIKKLQDIQALRQATAV